MNVKWNAPTVDAFARSAKPRPSRNKMIAASRRDCEMSRVRVRQKIEMCIEKKIDSSLDSSPSKDTCDRACYTRTDSLRTFVDI